jgi:PAS domain S-box-containing protein
MTRDAIVVLDAGGRILGCNESFVQLWGLPAEWAAEREGAALLRAVQGQLEHPEQFLERVGDLFSDPDPRAGDLLSLRDGRVLERVYRPRRAGDTAPGRVWAFADVTERRRAEEALRASEALYHSVVESLPFSLFRKDLQGRFTFCNQAFAALVGRTPEELQGQTEILWHSAEAVDRIHAEEAAMLQARERREVFATLHGPEGHWITLHGIKMPVYDSQGRSFGIQGVFWDVTERERFAVLLGQEKERLAVTLRSIGEAVITTDLQGRVVLLNRIAAGLTGWAEVEAVGRHVGDVLRLSDPRTFHPCDDFVARVLQPQTVAQEMNSALLTSRDGRRRTVSLNAAAIRDPQGRLFGAVLVFRDTTERERMEAELLKVSKLESLGILAGGIAHDFNNILMVVLGNISMARMLPGCPSAVSDRLEQGGKACLRARDLTQQLLTFAKGGSPVKKAASLAELVRESASFALRGSNVKCVFDLKPDLRLVEVDVGQIGQAVNNLVINAVQAMPHGGVVTIRADNVPAGQKLGLPLEGQDYVHCSIADQGIGIRPEQLSKIFDPFFTTKPTGSGLGLTTAYSVIKKHDGLIEVESAPATGSVFHLYLPASRRTQALPSQAPVRPAAGHGRILVMDDEPLIGELASSILSGLGYQVVVAMDGAEAVDIYRRAVTERVPFSAVIMDLMVPGGMGGREAVRRLLEVDPGARVIVSSGYSNDPVMADYARYGFLGVVAKPYIVEELSRVLEEVLRAPSRRFVPPLGE